jgi:uncharacterized protein YbjT (DUF2867 family)
MRILVVGASRGCGALSVKEALARGHSVTAMARHPEKLPLSDDALTRYEGDFHRRASVEAVVKGHDAVIITASVSRLSDFKRNLNYFSLGTRYVIEAMRESGVRRLVVLSALGTGESRRLMGFVTERLVVSWLLRRPFEDHERQEKLVMESGLDWTIARPGRLTDGPGRRQYEAKTEIEKVPASISRADVADFMINAVEEDTWLGQAVQLGG